MTPTGNFTPVETWLSTAKGPKIKCPSLVYNCVFRPSKLSLSYYRFSEKSLIIDLTGDFVPVKIRDEKKLRKKRQIEPLAA